MTGCDDYPAELAVGVTSSRVAQLSPAARELHRVILASFATAGQAPGRAALEANTPAGHDLGALLAELHERDVVRCDATGHARAAYPFSGVPTAHVVSISRGPTVYAMCAVDALGIADMLGRAVTINSTDPVTGEAITITVTHGESTWSPDTTVVYVGATKPALDSQQCRAAAEDRCCTVMNFFARAQTARQWSHAHPQVSGTVLTQGQALRLGVDIFGRLLNA